MIRLASRVPNRAAALTLKRTLNKRIEKANGISITSISF